MNLGWISKISHRLIEYEWCAFEPILINIILKRPIVVLGLGQQKHIGDELCVPLIMLNNVNKHTKHI
jgi:hypothetical protein